MWFIRFWSPGLWRRIVLRTDTDVLPRILGLKLNTEYGGNIFHYSPKTLKGVRTQKTRVLTTNVPLNGISTRLKGNVGKYAGGGSVTARGWREGVGSWDFFPSPRCRLYTLGRWSLAQKKEHILQEFENKMLRIVSEPKKDEGSVVYYITRNLLLLIWPITVAAVSKAWMSSPPQALRS
jgi:hypothetical protein